MSQILWIGCLESDDEFKIKAEKGCNLASAQVSQKNLLQGIEERSNMIFDSINGSVLPHYPIYKDKFVKPVIWHHKEKAFDISVGYRNSKYINRLYCKRAMLRAADLWVKNRYQGGELIVFTYSMRSAPMATACRIKEKIPQAKIYLLITDLPQFMDLGQNRTKAFLKRLDWIAIKEMQSQFDGFILYAEKMSQFLGLPKNKWILVEGSYDVTDEVIENKEKRKAIMYSGRLDEQYGIKLLLEAFMQIQDSSIELWLTGGGNAEKYIKECEKKDKRIKYYGFLPSRQEVLEKQAEASLLINMRLPSEPASDYCFPSKLFEYMATGTPVISFDIGGIPREYLQYLYIVKEEEVTVLAHEIEKVMALDNEILNEMGKKAREFILSQKNTSMQSKRIIDFVMRGE